MDPLTKEEFVLFSDHWEAMLNHISSMKNEEACGLIGGKNRCSSMVFTITNELHSPVRYRLDPQEQLNAFLEIESQGLDLIAIFHSHLNGPNRPSKTDITIITCPAI